MSNLPFEQDPTSIGNILVAMECITEEDLLLFVSEFRKSQDELLGEFIVRKTEKCESPVTTRQVEIARIRQDRLRGKSNEATISRLMEISQSTHNTVINKVDELAALTVSMVKVGS